MTQRLNLSILLLALAIGCGESAGGDGGASATGGTGAQGGSGGVTAGNCHESVPPLLSEWGLFSDIRNQVPAEGVVPFEVTSALFTDFALKRRFVALTEGGQIEYFDDATRWQSPVGTVYVKTFAYPPNKQASDNDGLEQLIETRLLVHVAAEDDRFGCDGEASCWNAITYVYDDEQTDAVCEAGGVFTSITFTDATDEQVTIEDYRVPSNGECASCHGPRPETRTLGPNTGMLNRGNDYQGNEIENQIDALDEAGWLDPSPLPFDQRTTYPDPFALIEGCQTRECTHEAASAYLHMNCSHCHASDGVIDDQGLFLDWDTLMRESPGESEFSAWGVCRTPTSAGNLTDLCKGKPVDIWPGDPDRSLLLCRLESTTIGEMMPEIGRSVVHEDAVALVRQWILDMPTLFPGIKTCGAAEE